MSLVTVSENENGRSCPYCRFPLKGGSVAVQCDACSAIHHEDCWADGHGCAVLGCVNSAAAQPAQQPQAQPLARGVPVGKPVVGPPGGLMAGKTLPAATLPPSAAPPESGGKSNGVLFAAIGVLAAALVATVVALAVNMSSGGEAASLPPQDDSPAEEPRSEVPQESDSVAARRVVRVLRDYSAAFSGGDRQGLSSLFAPDVQRWGVNGPDTCAHDVGKHAVLNAYQTQFDLDSSYDYQLTPLGKSDVDRLSETRARVLTNYVIDGGAPDAISFSLERSESAGWRISRVKVGDCV